MNKIKLVSTIIACILVVALITRHFVTSGTEAYRPTTMVIYSLEVDAVGNSTMHNYSYLYNYVSDCVHDAAESWVSSPSYTTLQIKCEDTK